MKIQQARYHCKTISDEKQRMEIPLATEPDKIIHLSQVIQADYYQIDAESIAEKIINRNYRA